MSGFLLTLLLSFFIFSGSSEGSHEPAVVVGTVYCDTCFHQDFPRATHFISGATVAVECRYGKSSRPSFRQQVKTNRHGEFRVHLPFSVSKHVKKIQGCSVKLIKSSEPYCAVASSATSSSSSLHLKSRKQGTHIFSAGFFTFKPLEQPFLCNQKPSVDSLNQPQNRPPSSVHPNQFLPPPILLPPNPFQPPTLLPPSPLQPPPAPVTPSLPPAPGRIPPPSPPSSPPPEFPFPLPPALPFPPIPPFPGVPPAKSSP
ncbi:hypothetical protein V6N11_051312 [Hibiscus sabdariffa]|uniref:Uncharacterized protein n=1 Tax=Hibiscus sabdariffa TaxID=183260 RepID=A0ABR2AEE0_9ROSI